MALKPVSAKPWSPEQRESEIDKVVAGFVTTGPTYQAIYRALIEHLFPPGSGLPGPVLTRQDMRDAVHSVKPGYKDVFRRVRELQGEEGLHGLVKEKTKYQLQHLAIAQKREPRKPLKASTGRKIALAQGSRCTVCGQPIVVNGDTIHVDHRVPRDRGGNSHESNLQVLCAACNVSKSSSCSGCKLPCQVCPWAFPEQYKLPRLRSDVILRLNDLARKSNRSVDEITNEILDKNL